MKSIKIPELKIEITEPKKLTKPYNEIKIPGGWNRLPKVTELIEIHESKHKDFIFGGEGFLAFACEQLSIDKENNWSRWIYRYWDDDLDARGDVLLGSYSNGWVCFVRGLE